MLACAQITQSHRSLIDWCGYISAEQQDRCMHCTGTAHSSIEHQHVQETARDGATIMALHAASKYHARWQGSLHFVIKVLQPGTGLAAPLYWD